MGLRLTKPPALKPGDTVAIAAPSSYPFDAEIYRIGICQLEKLGFRVKEGSAVSLRHRYAAGSRLERARDLQHLFEDNEVRCIVSTIGGSVASDLLDLLNYDSIRYSPKVFTGLSDITHLHLALLSCAGLVTLHHLDLMFGFAADPSDPAIAYSLELFLRVTMRAEALGRVPAFTTWEAWREGRAEGRLVGGWLPALVTLAGTRYWPRVDKAILFWEISETPLNEVERLLTALRLKGVFERVSGMVVGKTRGCSQADFRDLSMRDLVCEVLDSYPFPILGEVDFGHVDQNIPLPEGILARIDTTALSLDFLEPMVT